MFRIVRKSGWAASCLGGLLGVFLFTVAVPAGEGPLPLWRVSNDETTPPKYWLGVACSATDDQQGVTILQVVPHSPAAAAGLQEGDLLLQFGEQKLTSVVDLVEAVRKEKDEATTLHFRRGDEEKQVQITPAKRPAHTDWGELDNAHLKAWQQARKLYQDLGAAGQSKLYLHPGMMFPPPASWGVLPEGFKITIEGRGAKPAAIVITNGDQTIETTTDKLHELPAELSQHFFGKAIGDSPLASDFPGESETLRFHQFFWRPTTESKHEAIDKLQNEVDELRAAVKELQKKAENQENAAGQK